MDSTEWIEREVLDGLADEMGPGPCTAGVRWNDWLLEIIQPFGFDQSGLTLDLQRQVASVVDTLVGILSQGRDIQTVRLVGHTDSTGPMFYNDALGKRRADAVAAEIARLIRQRAPRLAPRLAASLRNVRIVTETRGARDAIRGSRRDNASNRHVRVYFAELLRC
jgi:outer membrane protein OmpA-like peptidoglycan-associated protein